MSISKQLFNIRRDGVIGDGRGNIFPLTTYDKEELIGITFFYGIWMGNPNNKSKKQLIKAIQSNKNYQKRIRREERNPRVNSVLKRTANKIIRELRQEARTESQQFEEPDFLDEVETQTSIAFNIMERANKTSSTDPDWYATELQSELSLAGGEMSVDEIRTGDFIFFGYSAEYPEDYEYYDRRPLAYILDMQNNKMLGCNVHYLNPDIRDGFAQTMLNKSAIQVPSVFSKTIHSYLYTNISSVFRVPAGEYGDIARLVTEDFIDANGEKYDITAVWDSVN